MGKVWSLDFLGIYIYINIVNGNINMPHHVYMNKCNYVYCMYIVEVGS